MAVVRREWISVSLNSMFVTFFLLFPVNHEHGDATR